MSEEQVNRIIQLLERLVAIEEAKPLSPRPYFGTSYLITDEGPYLQGTCMACLKGTCDKKYSHT